MALKTASEWRGRVLASGIAILGLMAWAAEPARAVPVPFGSSFYDFVAVTDPFTGSNNSWDTARAAAETMVFNGVNGHLATVTSQAENDFLFSLASGQFTGFAGAWLGGKSPEGWLVGPEAGQGFTFTNWAGVEPNNNGFAYMSIGTVFSPGQWADDSGVQGLPDPNLDPVVGYFVEFEQAVAATAPGTVALFGIALFTAGLSRRRRPR